MTKKGFSRMNPGSLLIRVYELCVPAVLTNTEHTEAWISLAVAG